MTISKKNSEILFTHDIKRKLDEIIEDYPKGKIFLATESNVKELCLPIVQDFIDGNNIYTIEIPANEANKNINSVSIIWEALSKNGADRKSLLINIGGGMLTDLAGFAATTFKRGIDFVNIPTTLLSQVDASVGGKTGMNFNGLKNEIGTFKEPNAVLINTNFLKTIDRENFISGYAEMIKHGLIKSENHYEELKDFDLNTIDYKVLQDIIKHSVSVKEYFVSNDPFEKNIRKALNFGHTAGHAFESFAMYQNRPILHGYGVAYGMLVELFLSSKVCEFSSSLLKEISDWLISLYGKFEIETSDYEALYKYMTHDKKNEDGRINFTLISEVGKFKINQNCNRELIFEALDYYKNL